MAASQLQVIRVKQLEAEGEHCQIPVGKMPKLTMKEAEAKMAMRVEPRTGVSFQVELQDGRRLHCVGLRRKKIVAIGINIYDFGMYADNAELKDLVRSKCRKASKKPMRKVYEAVIDSDVAVMVRLVIVFRALNMWKVRKSIDQGIGGSLKKLNGGRSNDELAKKYTKLLRYMILGDAKDNMKTSPGSVIEISRLPGYILETKELFVGAVRDELVSNVESELPCRAYINMYLGEDAFDKYAKERFGRTLLSLRCPLHFLESPRRI